LRVATSCTARAVVAHCRQSAFAATAALSGVTTWVWPTTRTTWKATATVVQYEHEARA
jgi:hypothetical protein